MPQLQGNIALAQPNSTDVKDAAAATAPVPFPTPNLNPLKEYVAGGALTYLQDYFRALPQYIDDVSADFGLDVYERMLKDSQVTSAFESLRMAVMASGFNINGKVTDENDPDFDLSQEITQFIESNLKTRLKQPFVQTCYDLLEGMAFGHKVAELVYEYAGSEAQDEFKGKLLLKAIKVKPQRVTAFVVDAFFNTVALVALIPGQGASTLSMQGLIGVPAQNIAPGDVPPNFLPREKFCVFTFRPQDNDPRGTSILRPAYDPWWCKQQVKKDYLAYMARFASPSLIGKTPVDSNAFPVSDSYANPTTDTNGVQQYLNPEQIMGAALANFKNGTYLVVPGGSEVTPLEATGNGEAFDKAFNFYNTEITKGIQYQALSTNEGQHQSRAASQTHENIKDMVINFAKDSLENCVNQDIIYNLVRYNYGEDAAQRLSPTLSLAEGAAQDFAKDASAIANLTTSGFLHISQYPGIDSRLGLPPRDLEAQMQDMAEQKQAQADQQQQQLEIARAKVQQPQPQPGQEQPQPPDNQGNQAAPDTQDNNQQQQDGNKKA